MGILRGSALGCTTKHGKKPKHGSAQVLVAKSLSHPFLGSLYGTCGGMSSFLAEKLAMSFLFLIAGLYGGSIVVSPMVGQSKPLYQSCFFTFSVPPFFIGKRSDGFALQLPLMRPSGRFAWVMLTRMGGGRQGARS